MTEKDINGLFGWIAMTQLAIRLVPVTQVTGKIEMDSLSILSVKPQLVFKLKSDLGLMDLLTSLTSTTNKVYYKLYLSPLSK